jgi:NAD(P)-dependent dehydrogenase (short-subunit alcohol dehydrogenase family)
MGRMASLKDLEPAMRMLLSQDNRYMTGAEIIIDGGWTII